ncbi:FKBP-type peptidyl-prolyl cis-trans isomerase [Actinomadura violacea]|uniref:peptidylprolyl isomerase n=1 Tax=Actinomadura violacea TaxID=2819934 RepID=A0ABS3SA32_9ACTN|nr:FKBP-type peptidyl-prolyl cis-trans isomerase [Actinomadura violacea]MBO2465857.1 FKBP-type peptidyl-prolyl cis-trans isomerase [Actinomadura violacea]
MAEDDKPAVKAKIPNAKNIRSPEFTPHGISAGRGSGLNRPSALTAAQARKRRIATIAGIVVAVLAIAGGVTYYVTRPGPKIEVSGKFGAESKVKIPTKLAPSKGLKSRTLIKGSGPAIADGDTMFVQYSFYQWAKQTDADDSRKKSTSKKIGSSYEQGQQAQALTVGKSGVKGLDKGLLGKTAGSRVLVEVPPSMGFGDQGSQLGLGKNDSVVFVVDVQAVVKKNAGPQGAPQKLDDKSLPKVEDQGAGKAPKVTVPKTDAPSKLQAKTLVQGTGPALAKGDDAVVNYQGQIWKGGKVFDSSFKNGQPAMFPIGVGKTVPGFDKGLTGAKVGSRVLLVLPPAEGYGKNGNAQAGIKGTDTLVFVVDILAKVQK